MAQVIAHSLEAKNRTKDVTIEENVTFDSFVLSENILKGLKDSGFKKPSPIQCKAMPIGRCGFDLIVKSKSGTGKTLVYSVVALESINVEKQQTQAIILAPTREIAVQIQEVLISIARYMKSFKSEYFIGGLPLAEDKEKCQNCHVAVGAPGRIKHLITAGILNPNFVRLFVLDEADKLMEQSFLNDINEIFNALPDRKQIITASATYPENLKTFLQKYMLSPTFIETETDTPLLLGLKQFVQIVPTYSNAVQETKYKNEELLKIFARISFAQCLVFTNYQTRAESICNFLKSKGWSAKYISAAQSQPERLKTVRDLKNFKCKILLSTDLTARGIDAANVDLVVNYDTPVDATTYLHRMGRAGRYGADGICIDLVSNGVSLQKFRNILGTIGGCNLGVPKLPEFEGSVKDLLNLNVSNREFIYGTVPESVHTDSIKNNVLNIKADRSVQNFTKTSETIDEKHTEEQENLSTTPTNTVNTQNSIKNSKDSTKLYYENLALFGASKILSSKETVQLSETELFALDCYLENLQAEEQREIKKIQQWSKNKSAKDLLANLVNGGLYKEHFEDMPVDVDADNARSEENGLENIFKAGYDYAVNPTEKHWSSTLSQDEIRQLNELRLQEKCGDSYIETSQEEDDYDMEEDVSMEPKASGSSGTEIISGNTQPDPMKWIPVEKASYSTTKQPELPEREWLSSHLEACSENLWQRGLTFETIEDFDQWFYEDWQKQVFAVREYIQQNLYVHEMSKYQKSKRELYRKPPV